MEKEIAFTRDLIKNLWKRIVIEKFWNKPFITWILLAEKKPEDGFDKKHRKGLNLIRLLVTFLILWFSQTECFQLFFSDLAVGVVFILMFCGYCVLIIFKEWIIGVWDFLQKDSLIQYILLGAMLAFIVVKGFSALDLKKITLAPPESVGKIQKETIDIPLIRAEYDEIIDRLNGFYAVLFTAIAVIAGIAGISAWRGIKEMKDKLEDFKKIEDTVRFIKEKKELAQWVQNKFEKDDKKSIISMMTLPMDDVGDKKIYEEIKEKIIDETTDDSWLKIIYAKMLMGENHLTPLHEPRAEANFVRIEKLFEYVENRDLFKDDSDIEPYLFNLKGQLYWQWYKSKKKNYLKKNDPDKESTWNDWWKPEKKAHQFLEKSISSYRKAIVSEGNKKNSDPDESWGNLAVRLIEYAKFFPGMEYAKLFIGDNIKDNNEKEMNPLEMAKNKLNNVSDRTFNTYWDCARATYYLMLLEKDRSLTDQESIPVLDELTKAAKKINTRKDKDFFLDTITAESKERVWKSLPGFPGEGKIFAKMEEILDKKILS